MLNLIRCSLAAALSLLAFPALAQQGGGMKCAPVKAMLDLLSERYHETPVYAGSLTGALNGAPMFITVSPTGTWTMLVTGPEGKNLCVGLTGENWTARALPTPVAPGEGA